MSLLCLEPKSLETLGRPLNSAYPIVRGSLSSPIVSRVPSLLLPVPNLHLLHPPDVLVAILLPRHHGLREAKLRAGQVERVGLTVCEEDVQDLVLVFGRLPVLADEAAAVDRVEAQGDFAGFGAEIW